MSESSLMDRNARTMRKVKVQFSPYTYARVAAMKSSLLSKEDYDRLLKMGYHEILRSLQDSAYEQEIDKYDVSTQGLKVIEQALNANLLRICLKLHRISLGGMKEAIAKYLLRYDLENIKAIIRSTQAGIAADEVRPLLYESVNYPAEFWEKILAKDKIEDIVALLPFLKNYGRDGGKKDGSELKELFEIENALDTYYVETVMSFASSVRGQGKVLKELWEEEIETMNIKTILRLLEEKEYDAADYLIKPSKLVLKMAKLRSIEEIVALLRKDKRTELKGDEDDILARLEIDLEKTLLQKERQLMHRNLLSANYVLGFLFAKEIEVRNLKILVKGRKLSLPDDYIQKMMVVAA
ncbi:hypothetical protein COV20_01585 [Candidatus Woesearchaeota archaeon CG10_big_fil_rev_8_21_14_0_10_45_16]|nr:MAG: hypothetical protein COV20_01585 [Candidatus Woesearchaeota archaeon CG10_big_fil_rev_8_21_14_0_10_45_16]